MGPFALTKWEATLSNYPIFLEGLGTTLIAAVAGLVLALMLGIIFGVLSTASSKITRGLSRV